MRSPRRGAERVHRRPDVVGGGSETRSLGDGGRDAVRLALQKAVRLCLERVLRAGKHDKGHPDQDPSQHPAEPQGQAEAEGAQQSGAGSRGGARCCSSLVVLPLSTPSREPYGSACAAGRGLFCCGDSSCRIDRVQVTADLEAGDLGDNSRHGWRLPRMARQVLPGRILLGGKRGGARPRAVPRRVAGSSVGSRTGQRRRMPTRRRSRARTRASGSSARRAWSGSRPRPHRGRQRGDARHRGRSA